MRDTRQRLLGLLVVIGVLLLASAPGASAQTAPYCRSGQTPQFVFGFKALSDNLGERMGQPLECEHSEATTGDTHQRTTRGLAFYRKATNTPTFTNGFEHWALDAIGLLYWTGDSIDPPASGAASPTPPGAQAADPDHPILAFYYTWYDPSSFGSRTAFQPAVDRYNSDDPALIEQHVRQARAAGIDGFVVAWDGAGGRTDRNFQKVLNAGAKYGLRATIYFETHNFTPFGPGDVADQLRKFYAAYVDKNLPNLVRYQGKPVIFLWATRLLSLDTWASIRTQVDPEQRAVWIAEGDVFSQLQGDTFQGIHPYSIAWSATPARTLASYGTRAHAYPDKLWVPTAMPGYDDTRDPYKLQRGEAVFARDRGNGAFLTDSFQGAVASNPDWAILLTSFNEWYEGHQLEPAREYGNLYLDLLGQLVNNYRSGG
ncbi:MAG: hypothetical protein HY690_08795 [Chloroflexi bacterium]|nr:hypothetical protein [Chloroflexota bacterium]